MRRSGLPGPLPGPVTRNGSPLAAHSCGGSAGIAPASRLGSDRKDRTKNLDMTQDSRCDRRVKHHIKNSLYLYMMPSPPPSIVASALFRVHRAAPARGAAHAARWLPGRGFAPPGLPKSSNAARSFSPPFLRLASIIATNPHRILAHSPTFPARRSASPPQWTIPSIGLAPSAAFSAILPSPSTTATFCIMP
jgi:hypothetical protein